MEEQAVRDTFFLFYFININLSYTNPSWKKKTKKKKTKKKKQKKTKKKQKKKAILYPSDQR
jgi:hypothetical protein